MCIAAFAWQDHPIYELILLLNRDEYHDRPTKPLAWWDGAEIVGGRDEFAGGTWLASSRDGRLAFVTNFREVRSLPEAKSRGDLPVRFLESQKSAAEFASEVVEEADHYNGFNLILADLCLKTMFYVTNRPEEEKASASEVSPGIHVLSNAKLDFPWPKVTQLHQNFEELLGLYGENEVPIKEMIEKIMMDTTKADMSMLPGIYPPKREYTLSSIFIIEDDNPLGMYGTRSTSAVTVKPNGDVCFYERHLEDETWKEQAVTYCIKKKDPPPPNA